MWIKLIKSDKIVILHNPNIKVNIDKLEIVLTSNNESYCVTSFDDESELMEIVRMISQAIENNTKGYVKKKDGTNVLEIF